MAATVVVALATVVVVEKKETNDDEGYITTTIDSLISQQCTVSIQYPVLCGNKRDTYGPLFYTHTHTHVSILWPLGIMSIDRSIDFHTSIDRKKKPQEQQQPRYVHAVCKQ